MQFVNLIIIRCDFRAQPLPGSAESVVRAAIVDGAPNFREEASLVLKKTVKKDHLEQLIREVCYHTRIFFLLRSATPPVLPATPLQIDIA